MPVVAKEHIYEYDSEGNPSKLLVAKGDVVPEGVSYKKSQVEEEAVRISPAQEALLYGTQAPSQERSMDIAEDNARIQAEERAKDAANHGLSMDELADRSLGLYSGEGADKALRGPKEPGVRMQDAGNPAVEAGLANPDTAGEEKAEAKEAAEEAAEAAGASSKSKKK